MTFSFKGIASKREYAFTLVLIIAVETLVSSFFSWIAPRFIGESIFNTNALVIGTISSYAVYIAAVAAQFAVTTRRLRGMGRSPLLAILLIVPIVNLIFSLTLLFGPESTDHHDENGLGDKEVIDQHVIDEELKRQTDAVAFEEATKGANIVDTEAKDMVKDIEKGWSGDENK